MRLSELILDIQAKFPVLSDRGLAKRIAHAVQDAQLTGRGTFTYNDELHVITAEWHDGCISGDCNPATCWTDFRLDAHNETE